MFAPRSKNTASWLRLINDIRRYGSEVKNGHMVPMEQRYAMVIGWSLIGLKLISIC